MSTAGSRWQTPASVAPPWLAGGASSSRSWKGACSGQTLSQWPTATEAAFLAALDTVPAPSSIVLTGRRHGEVVGVATAWHDGEIGGTVEVYVLVEETSRRQGVGRALLQALHASVQRHGWAEEGARGYGAEGFFTSASAWIREIRPAVVL